MVHALGISSWDSSTLLLQVQPKLSTETIDKPLCITQALEVSQYINCLYCIWCLVSISRVHHCGRLLHLTHLFSLVIFIQVLCCKLYRDILCLDLQQSIRSRCYHSGRLLFTECPGRCCGLFVDRIYIGPSVREKPGHEPKDKHALLSGNETQYPHLAGRHLFHGCRLHCLRLACSKECIFCIWNDRSFLW